MKKDNRIVRPEQLNDKEMEMLERGIDKYVDTKFKKERALEEKRKRIEQQMIRDGELEERDGKIYVVDKNFDVLRKLNDAKLNKLQEKRIERGLSQSELAEKSGVTLRMIQAYEQDYKDINGAKVVTVIKLADALNCNIDEIIKGGNVMTNYSNKEIKAMEKAIEVAGENVTDEYLQSNIDNGYIDIVRGRGGQRIADYVDMDGHEGHVWVDTMDELTEEEVESELL